MRALIRQPKGITKITYVRSGNPSPLSASTRTGEVFVNENHWGKFDYYERYFMLKHEEGHIVLQTRSEELADAYAWAQYIKAKYPISKSIFALSSGLNFSNPEHMDRLLQQVRRAFNWDYYVNGNKKVIPIKSTNPQDIMNAIDYYMLGENADVSLFGITLNQKQRDRKAARQEARKENRVAKITARGTARAQVAASGGGFMQNLGKVAGSIMGGAASNIFGGGGGGGMADSYDDTGTAPTDNPGGSPPAKKSSPLLWIIIAVVVLLIIFLVYRKMKKK